MSPETNEVLEENLSAMFNLLTLCNFFVLMYVLRDTSKLDDDFYFFGKNHFILLSKRIFRQPLTVTSANILFALCTITRV